MTTSTEIKNIAAALVGFHKEVEKIEKDSKNPFFKSSYASLSGILETINAPLINNGLAVVQFPEGENGLTTRLLHVSGEWMESTYVMPPVKNTPQDRGSALTYQRRYAIGAILSLNIADDDDGHAASQPPKKEAVTKPATQPQTPPLNETEFKVLEGVVSKCETTEALNELFANQEQKVKDYTPAKALFTERKKQIIIKTATQINGTTQPA